MATAMDIYMQALDEAVIGENDDCINYVIDYLSYTSEKMNKWDDKLYILPNRRRAYENILSKIEGRKDVSDIKFTIKMQKKDMKSGLYPMRKLTYNSQAASHFVCYW